MKETRVPRCAQPSQGVRTKAPTLAKVHARCAPEANRTINPTFDFARTLERTSERSLVRTNLGHLGVHHGAHQGAHPGQTELRLRAHLGAHERCAPWRPPRCAAQPRRAHQGAHPGEGAHPGQTELRLRAHLGAHKRCATQPRCAHPGQTELRIVRTRGARHRAHLGAHFGALLGARRCCAPRSAPGENNAINPTFDFVGTSERSRVRTSEHTEVRTFDALPSPISRKGKKTLRRCAHRGAHPGEGAREGAQPSRGAHPGEGAREVRTRGKPGSDFVHAMVPTAAKVHARCAPGANRAPTSCTPHLGAHFGALLGAHHGAHQGAQPRRRCTRGAHPGQTGLRLRARRTLEHTSERSLVRTMVPTRARNPAEGAREVRTRGKPGSDFVHAMVRTAAKVRTRGKPGSDFVHAAPWSTLRSAPWCAPGRATQPRCPPRRRCTRGAYPGQTGLRLRARRTLEHTSERSLVRTMVPTRPRNPAKVCAPRCTRGAHPGQTGVRLRARRTLEHTSGRSRVRTGVAHRGGHLGAHQGGQRVRKRECWCHLEPALVRSPAKVCAPRCPPWRRCAPGQLTQLPTSRAPGWERTQQPGLGRANARNPTKRSDKKRGGAPVTPLRSAPWANPAKVPTPAKVQARCAPGANRAPTTCTPHLGAHFVALPGAHLRAHQGGQRVKKTERACHLEPALVRSPGKVPTLAKVRTRAINPTSDFVRARVATGPRKSQCEKPHQTLRQKKRRRSNNPASERSRGKPSQGAHPDEGAREVRTRGKPGSDNVHAAPWSTLRSTPGCPPALRTVVGSEPRQGMRTKVPTRGAHPGQTGLRLRAGRTLEHTSERSLVRTMVPTRAHPRQTGLRLRARRTLEHTSERSQPRQVVRTKVPTLAEVRARGKPGSDFVHCMVPTKARNPAKVPTAAKVHARCAPEVHTRGKPGSDFVHAAPWSTLQSAPWYAPGRATQPRCSPRRRCTRGAHPGQTGLGLRARRTLEHTSERSRPRQVVRTKAPTLAKVGHGVGPRVGNGVGTKVTGWLSGWASRSQGGWQVAKLRAKVGVGVGAKDPRWVPRNQGGCLGGCRGGSQGGSQGECKGGCQGQGECQCGFQGARVRVSANVGSKVLSWVRGWVRGWVGAKVVAPEVVCGHRVADGTLHAHDAPSRCTHVGRAGCTPDALARCAHPGRAHTWRTGRTSRGRVCTSTGVGGRGGFARGSRFAKYTLRQAHNGCDHTSVSAPDPIRTPQLSALGPE
ncbi:hypothetical protein SUGI_1436310 [Cryptomeria japonica]|uniref:BZIP domain-containing protein n=3 Tax=Cryptomeria japonica TaxID=3369 RepID=A0AAD3NST3_CRYJA|nr:hypothetical protein SUGI_1286140 [Cryptomeria japonica]GLJ58353.1 hypothetical protein SUGI_1436310 [Cryptomeria japonica]